MMAGISRWSLVGALLAFGLRPVAADTIAEKAAVCAACHGENGVPDRQVDPGHLRPERGLHLHRAARHEEGRAQERSDGAVRREHVARGHAGARRLFRRQALAQSAATARAAPPTPTISPRWPTSAGCVGCHQAGYIGAGTQPRLAGQSVDYLAKTMLDFRTGARANNTWMRDLLKTYSEDDIKQMARVLGGM